MFPFKGRINVTLVICEVISLVSLYRIFFMFSVSFDLYLLTFLFLVSLLLLMVSLVFGLFLLFFIFIVSCVFDIIVQSAPVTFILMCDTHGNGDLSITEANIELLITRKTVYKLTSKLYLILSFHGLC